MTSSKSNRLANEKSPYLQQHAHNPVEWWPWGPEAFAAAKERNKPIFLSIGYSTCHWCHVMAHESFENAEIAAIMNDRFINIKVDREERPDVDALYMSAVQALTGSGGWPMSVWLTPDLKPFFGGTYFPPEDRYGRPGFPTVLLQLSEIYEKDPQRIGDATGEIMDVVRRAAGAAFREKRMMPRAREVMASVLAALSASFDSKRGGFSPAPKFPMPVYLDYLLYHHASTGDSKALDMAQFTMRNMARGGVYDHLGGGFARYSTDDRWLVPHFEKMLYDNAQLLRACAQLAVATGDRYFENIARDTVRYLNRDLRHPDGAYYSAEDADSEGKEGTFYVWTLAELKSVLGPDAEFATQIFGVTVNGNFVDPHHPEPGRNVLSVETTIDDAAARFGMDLKTANIRFQEIRQRLFDQRARRPRPHRDEKILTEWNGLAISALAKAGFLLDDQDLVADAKRAATFIQSRLYNATSKKLYRRWRDGERAVDGNQADHAMLVEGLLDLFEASGETEWLRWALEIQEIQDKTFFDSESGGYFMSSDTPDLLVRLKDDADNVIPSGNSVAVSNGLRLTALTGRPEFRDRAVTTLRLFAGWLADRPFAVTKLVSALDWEQSGHLQIVVAGDPSSASSRALMAVLRRRVAGARQVVQVDPQRQVELAQLMPHLSAMPPIQGAGTAYVCKDFACRAPVSDASVLDDLLKG